VRARLGVLGRDVQDRKTAPGPNRQIVGEVSRCEAPAQVRRAANLVRAAAQTYQPLWADPGPCRPLALQVATDAPQQVLKSSSRGSTVRSSGQTRSFRAARETFRASVEACRFSSGRR
jgi:hypothetical protein